jgi:hypothetical protein
LRRRLDCVRHGTGPPRSNYYNKLSNNYAKLT